MVQAWYMDDSIEDQQSEHHRQPPKFISLNELYNISGVEYFQIKPSADDETLMQLKEDRGYSYEDEIICSEDCLPNYEEKLKMFYEEHLHADEEIRLFIEGSGYFDVRDKYDQWIRIKAERGDMLILPAGVYHRFTLDHKNYAKVKRFFIGEPVWTAHNRPADNMTIRKQYIEQLQKGFSNKA